MIDKKGLIDIHSERTNRITFIKHVATGNKYVIEEVIQDATNSNDGGYIVVYRELHSSKKWCREINEFCDGRFILE